MSYLSPRLLLIPLTLSCFTLNLTLWGLIVTELWFAETVAIALAEPALFPTGALGVPALVLSQVTAN